MRRTDSAEDDTLELLTGLVDKSMVVAAAAVPGRASACWRHCGPTAGTGCGRMTHENAAGDGSRAARDILHQLAERGATAMHGPDEQAWIERMAPTAGTTFTSPDHDNLRSAFERAMAVR